MKKTKNDSPKAQMMRLADASFLSSQASMSCIESLELKLKQNMLVSM